MGFGVEDLFGILAGGAWLTKEAIKENLELAGNRAHAEKIMSFIEEHTDTQLEENLRKDILNPDCYDSVWIRLETYKRDNPVWCKRHEEKGWQGQYTGVYYEPHFGWQDVGIKRLPFWGDDESALNQKERAVFDVNRGIALNLLMQTYGKMSLAMARIKAEEKYPLPKSK